MRSSGTGDWHVGRPMDTRAAATLLADGLRPEPRTAPSSSTPPGRDDDLVLAMDHDNLADLGGRGDRRRRCSATSTRSGAGEDVPDPYYGGADGFGEVLAIVERTSDALVAELEKLLGDA